jgi:hypothetical protein
MTADMTDVREGVDKVVVDFEDDKTQVSTYRPQRYRVAHWNWDRGYPLAFKCHVEDHDDCNRGKHDGFAMRQRRAETLRARKANGQCLFRKGPRRYRRQGDWCEKNTHNGADFCKPHLIRTVAETSLTQEREESSKYEESAYAVCALTSCIEPAVWIDDDPNRGRHAVRAVCNEHAIPRCPSHRRFGCENQDEAKRITAGTLVTAFGFCDYHNPDDEAEREARTRARLREQYTRSFRVGGYSPREDQPRDEAWAIIDGLAASGGSMADHDLRLRARKLLERQERYIQKELS